MSEQFADDIAQELASLTKQAESTINIFASRYGANPILGASSICLYPGNCC